MHLVRNLLSALLVLSMTSCVRDTDLDSGEIPQVVVECILTNSSVQTLRLCYTKGASREREPLTEAEALLFDVSADANAGSFSFAGEDGWTLGYEPVAGHTYRLEVRVPGYDLITAEQTMPELTSKRSCITRSSMVVRGSMITIHFP